MVGKIIAVSLAMELFNGFTKVGWQHGKEWDGKLQETINMDKIEKEFNTFKANENWGAMGDFFWRGFAAEGKERELYEKLWDSLTKNQKQMCEG